MKSFQLFGFSPQAVLWDMDGTVVDSEPEWDRATRQVIDSHGGHWTQADATFVLGCNSEDHVNRMLEALARDGIAANGQKMMEEVVESVRAHIASAGKLMPGAPELLKLVRQAGIPQCLVTASPTVVVEALQNLLVERIGFQPFDQIVSSDDDVAGKPDPGPYLLAANRVGALARNCIAFEDSVHGLESARAAGCYVVDVGQTPLVSILDLL